jgi:hypothetical protein
MLRYWGIWVVGLALSLAGCAGTQQGLVAQSPAKENVASRLLSWRGRPTTTTVDKTDDASARSSAPTDAKTARASTATTTTADPTADRAPSAARRDQVADRVSRFFPLFNRGDNNTNTRAKAEFVAPAERDVWAESARRGLQARAERARQQQRAAGEDDGESSVLPVAMDVGPTGTSVRPQAVSSMIRPRPATATATATAGGASEADPNANAATLPGPIEPVSGSRVEQTSAQAVAVPDTPPAPNTTAAEPAAAPPGATPPSPAPAPTTTTEPAPRPATTTPAAEAPAPAEPVKATEAEPAKPTEAEPAASPAPEPQAVPQAAPQASPQVPAAPLVPSAAPAAPAKAAPVVAPTAQASAQAPVACKGHCDQGKCKKKCWLLQHLAALFGHKPKPHTHVHKPVAKTLPAPQLPTKQMPAQPAAPAKAPISSQQATVRNAGVSPSAPTYTTAGLLFPSAYYVDPGPAPYYYVNPGADAARRMSSTATRPANPVGAGAGAAPDATRPRPSLLDRLVARFQGVEEVESHPLGCDCGKHPRFGKDQGKGKGPDQTPPPSLATKPRDVPEARERIERVSANRFDEAAER